MQSLFVSQLLQTRIGCNHCLSFFFPGAFWTQVITYRLRIRLEGILTRATGARRVGREMVRELNLAISSTQHLLGDSIATLKHRL